MLALFTAVFMAAVLFTKRRRILSLPFLSLATYGLLGVPGSWIVRREYNWWLRDVQQAHIDSAYYVYCWVGVIASCAVLVLLKNSESREPLDKWVAGAPTLLVFAAASAVMVAITVMTIFPDSALRELLSGNGPSALLYAELRGEMGSLMRNDRLLAYFNNILVNYFLMYMAVLMLVSYYTTKKHGLLTLWVYACFVFCSAQGLAKSPIVIAVIMPAIVKMYMGKISMRSVLSFVAGVSVLILVLYVVVMGSDTQEVAADIFNRLAIAQYAGLPLTLEVFDDASSHLPLLSSVGALAKIAGVEKEFFSRTLMEFANPDGVMKGLSGYMSTVAYAEGYAIGGYGGLSVAALLVAIVVGFYHNFDRLSDIRWRSFYLLLCMKLPLLIMDSASSLIWNYGLFFLIVIINCWMAAEASVRGYLNGTVDSTVSGLRRP